MKIRRLLSVYCAVAMLGGLFVGTAPAYAASPSYTRSITISAPNTPTGCAAPLAAFDTSAAPFQSGGPFTVTGYYKCRKDGVMYKDNMTSGAATVFGTNAIDTGGQWRQFSAFFNTTADFALNGIDLWYMAGELSICNVVIQNAGGQVVYNMETDETLTPMKTTALARKGIWYFYTFSTYPDFLMTVTAPEASFGLVDGSAYTLENSTLSGIPYGTDVATVRSNLTRADRVTAWKGSTKLTDSAIVTPDTTFVYNKGKSDARTLSVADMLGDCNNDGKLDIRDLRLIKETGFGRLSTDTRTGDIDGDGRVSTTDAGFVRSTMLGKPFYGSQSAGADALLQLANPVGRLHKDNNMLFMEHSAANFTLTGELQGDVTATVWAERTSSILDPIGLFIEVDGSVRFEAISGCSQYQNITLASKLSPGKHTIRVYKASDAANNVISVSAVRYCGKLSKTPAPSRRIEFLGDSITAGADVFPLDSAQRAQYGAITSYYSYAKMTADALGASHYCVANSGWRLGYSVNPQYTIRSVYPYTSMRSGYAGGEYAFDYDPDVVVINLGTNDRYTSDYSAYITDTTELLTFVRAKNPSATIIWAYGAMDTAHLSNDWIKTAVENFAATDGNTYFVPQGQNNAGANQHPNLSGQQINANTLANSIRAIKGWFD